LLLPADQRREIGGKGKKKTKGHVQENIYLIIWGKRKEKKTPSLITGD